MFDYNCIHLFVLFFTLKAKKAENNSAGNYFREHLSGVILWIILSSVDQRLFRVDAQTVLCFSKPTLIAGWNTFTLIRRKEYRIEKGLNLTAHTHLWDAVYSRCLYRESVSLTCKVQTCRFNWRHRVDFAGTTSGSSLAWIRNLNYGSAGLKFRFPCNFCLYRQLVLIIVHHGSTNLNPEVDGLLIKHAEPTPPPPPEEIAPRVPLSLQKCLLWRIPTSEIHQETDDGVKSFQVHLLLQKQIVGNNRINWIWCMFVLQEKVFHRGSTRVKNVCWDGDLCTRWGSFWSSCQVEKMLATSRSSQCIVYGTNYKYDVHWGSLSRTPWTRSNCLQSKRVQWFFSSKRLLGGFRDV